MTASDNETNSGSKRTSEDFQQAVNRLESAVQDFVTNANDSISERATEFVEDAARRLERELGGRRRSRHGRRRRRSSQHRGHSSSNRRGYGTGYRTRGLYRDTRRQKIAGVCAGLARYFGVETWVVRCIAVTGLIFMGQLVLPAYIIAWVLLDKAPNGDAEIRGSETTGSSEYASPAPELGPRLSPRRSLGDTQADLDQLELKLRRMEAHVTSGQYELQRELNRIDTDRESPG